MNDITDTVRKIIGPYYDISNYYYANLSKTFQGHFDGQGYSVILAINRVRGEKDIGLFGFLLGGVIENLSVYGKIIINTNTIKYVGGIVGTNDGVVKNCNNYAYLEDSAGYVGGIVVMEKLLIVIIMEQ